MLLGDKRINGKKTDGKHFSYHDLSVQIMLIACFNHKNDHLQRLRVIFSASKKKKEQAVYYTSERNMPINPTNYFLILHEYLTSFLTE